MSNKQDVEQNKTKPTTKTAERDVVKAKNITVNSLHYCF